MSKPTFKELQNLKNAARFDPYESPKPKAEMNVGGVVYSVEYFTVNRKCFDSFPTPTAMFKIDGKRVSRSDFFKCAE